MNNEHDPKAIPLSGVYRKRELTFEERSVWGLCPVCKAQHDQKCDGNVGNELAPARLLVDQNGVHFARLQHAPLYIALEPLK